MENEGVKLLKTLLLCGSTMHDIAIKAGVSTETVSSWHKKSSVPDYALPILDQLVQEANLRGKSKEINNSQAKERAGYQKPAEKDRRQALLDEIEEVKASHKEKMRLIEQQINMLQNIINYKKL